MTLSLFFLRLRAWWAGATPEQIAAVSDDVGDMRALIRECGHNWDHLADAEISAYVRALNRVVAKAGVTMEEAGQALKMNKQQGE